MITMLNRQSTKNEFANKQLNTKAPHLYLLAHATGDSLFTMTTDGKGADNYPLSVYASIFLLSDAH